MVLRPLKKSDYELVKRIYKQGIDTQLATFETKVQEWEYWNNKNLPFCRFVAELDNEIMGWAALSSVSKREVYKGLSYCSL